MHQKNIKPDGKEYQRVVPNEWLKKARQSRGWSQEELAARLDVTKKTVERWENGTAFPPPKRQEGLRHLFDMEAGELGLVRSEQRIPSLFHVLHNRNAYFTGRNALLTSLYDTLVAASEAQLPLALCGLGGIGKTQVAVEYTYRSHEMYQAVFWARADKYNVLVADFVEIASILHLPEQEDPNINRVIHAVRHWFMTHTDWLLVLDNVEDLDSIASFLPLNKRGHILLTSRAQVVGIRAEKIDVDKMNAEEGVTFFLHRTKKLAHSMSIAQADAGQRKLAAKIVREMDGLPLALDQAGAYIEEEGCGIEEYLELYHKQRDLLLRQRGMIDSGHPESVVATFLLSLERVKQHNQLATEILRLCAFVDPDAIPEELILADSRDSQSEVCRVKVGRVTFHKAVGELLKYSLIRRLQDVQMLTIHRLVQVVIQDAMEEDDRKLWSLLCISMVYEAMVASDQETMYLYDRYLSHALVCAKWIKQWNFHLPVAAYLLIDLSRYSRRQAFNDQAEKYVKRALDILHHCQPTEHSDIAIAYANLALAYQAQGRYQQAKLYFHQSMDLLAMKNPVEDEGLFALSLSNLASCEVKLNELVEAERHALQAKSILERIQASIRDVAYCLNILATIYREKQRFEDAKNLYEKVLAIREQLQKPGDVEVAASLNNLATIYIAQGKPVEAESLNQRALERYREVYGSEHPELARCLICLGDSAVLQNDWSLAEQYNQQALKMLSETVGADDYRLIEPLKNIAVCASYQKEYKRAQQFYKRALDLAEKHSDIDIVDLVNGYAELLKQAGQHDVVVGLKAHYQERLSKHEKGVVLQEIERRHDE